jgi:hypothetical protein
MRHKALVVVAALLPTLASCSSAVRPNIIRGSDSLAYVPKLQQVACDADKLGAPLPAAFKGARYVPQTSGELGGLAAILVSSLVGKGVDLLGQKLTARGEERTTTLEAQLNIDDPDMPVSCFQLSRDDGLLTRFALLPSYRKPAVGQQSRVDPTLAEIKVIALVYPRTINLESSGTRGLSLTVEAVRPNEEEPISQTVSLRNVQVGSRLSLPFEHNPFTSAYMQSPFVKSVKQSEEAAALPTIESDLPFTLRARLTEIRNANELYRLGGETVTNNRDSIVDAILKAIGAKEEEDASGNAGSSSGGQGGQGGQGGNDQTGQPPGTRDNPR